MADDRAVDLPDGTTVGVYEYGDPSGTTVFAFHGVPACGAGFDWADRPAKARGLRVLAPDRPKRRPIVGTAPGVRRRVPRQDRRAR